MSLVSIEQFVSDAFAEGSRPTTATVRRWIESGDVPGRRIGKLFFVDYASWQSRSNPIASRILNSARVSKAA